MMQTDGCYASMTDKPLDAVEVDLPAAGALLPERQREREGGIDGERDRERDR